MLAFYSLLLLVSCTFLVQAQRPSFGKCPSLGKLKPLDLNKLKGHWYEVERSFYAYELHRKCITIDIQPQGQGVRLATKFVSRITSNIDDDYANAVPYRENSPKLKVLIDGSISQRLPSSITRVFPGSGDYYVLDTDYDSFAVIYSCSNMASLLHADVIWVLSRTKELASSKRVDIYDTLIRNGLNSDILTLTEQKECPNL